LIIGVRVYNIYGLKEGVEMEYNIESLRNISVTESYSCPKPAWFRVKGFPKAPEHYYILRGHLLHSHIEDFLKANLVKKGVNRYWDISKNVDDLDLSDLLKSKLKEELNLEWKNFLTFYKAHLMEYSRKREVTKLVEEKISIELIDGFKLVGTPDLVVDHTIWDFKSGKGSRSISKEYMLQLGLYKILMHKSRRSNGDDLKLKLVFLGGPTYCVKEVIYTSGLQGDIQKVLNNIIMLRKQMINGVEPQGKFSFLCSMCSYRNVCRGV